MAISYQIIVFENDSVRCLDDAVKDDTRKQFMAGDGGVFITHLYDSDFSLMVDLWL